MLLRLGIINIPTSVGRVAWEECFDRTASRADIFGINESFSPRARLLYRRLAKARGLGSFGVIHSPNPVFYDADKWRRIAQNQYRLHGRGPLYFRWPGFNAPRYATVVVLRAIGGPACPDVTVINTHWVPRGRKVPDWWRTRARRRSIRKVTVIAERHRALGRIVIPLGDLNMTRAPDIPAVTWVADSGVDKLGVACPPGWEIVAEDVARYRAPTDHDHGTAAAVTLAPRSTP